MTESSGDTAMAEEGTRSRLGRGLAALIGDVGAERPLDRRAGSGGCRPVRCGRMRAIRGANFPTANSTSSPPRCASAASSSRSSCAPVRGVADGYEIVAGERRWRAAQRAGLHEVPVVVIEATDAEALQLAIIENVQRADLNPLEEADGYRALMDEFGNSQEEIAKIVGKSRSHVANTLRLLKLSDAVKAYIHSGKLTAGHARMLVGEPNADALADEIVARDLNVRQVEAMARERAAKSGKKQTNGRKARGATAKTADMLAFEKRVSDATGLVVSIDHHDDHGTLTIRYRSLEQLDDLVQRLVRGH